MQFMDTRAEKALLVPTEAVIQTGKRTVVMLAEDERPLPPGRGRDRHRERRPDRDQARPAGRPARRRVVAVPDRLGGEPEGRRSAAERRQPASPTQRRARRAAPRSGEAQGREASARDAITLSHGPDPVASKWGPMTMDFKLPPRGRAAQAIAGRRPRRPSSSTWTPTACRS